MSFLPHHFHRRRDSTTFVSTIRSASRSVVEEIAPKFAVGTWHLDRAASALFSNLMLVHGNGDMFSKKCLYEPIKAAYYQQQDEYHDRWKEYHDRERRKRSRTSVDNGDTITNDTITLNTIEEALEDVLQAATAPPHRL